MRKDWFVLGFIIFERSGDSAGWQIAFTLSIPNLARDRFPGLEREKRIGFSSWQWGGLKWSSLSAPPFEYLNSLGHHYRIRALKLGTKWVWNNSTQNFTLVAKKSEIKSDIQIRVQFTQFSRWKRLKKNTKITSAIFALLRPWSRRFVRQGPFRRGDLISWWNKRNKRDNKPRKIIFLNFAKSHDGTEQR